MIIWIVRHEGGSIQSAWDNERDARWCASCVEAEDDSEQLSVRPLLVRSRAQPVPTRDPVEAQYINEEQNHDYRG